jgi:hypothetical protein
MGGDLFDLLVWALRGLLLLIIYLSPVAMLGLFALVGAAFFRWRGWWRLAAVTPLVPFAAWCVYAAGWEAGNLWGFAFLYGMAIPAGAGFLLLILFWALRRRFATPG